MSEIPVEPPEWDKRKGPKPRPQVETFTEEDVEKATLMRGSDLLPPEAEIPVEIDPDEELPPAPTFIVVRNAFGPGAHSVKFSDGKPVGVWMREQQMTPEEVEEQLTSMGLDADLVADFVRRRAGGIAADKSLVADPTVAAFATEEARRAAAKEETSKAFVEAYRKKQKEKS